MDNTVAMATEHNSYTSGLLVATEHNSYASGLLFNFYWPFSGLRHLLVNSHSLCELVELHKQVNTKNLRNTLVLIFMNYTPFRYPPVIHAWVIFIFFFFLALDHQIQNKFLNKSDEFSVGGYDKLS